MEKIVNCDGLIEWTFWIICRSLFCVAMTISDRILAGGEESPPPMTRRLWLFLVLYEGSRV